MPAAAGHGAALPDATASSRIGEGDHRAAPPSRQKCTTTVSPLATSPPSNGPRNAPQPAGRRQIPIGSARPTAAPDPPAVSSPEACPTPAGRGQAPQPPVHGRRPTTLHKTRRTGASPGRSAPGGEADEIGGEAGVPAPMSAVRGRPDVPAAWPEQPLLANTGSQRVTPADPPCEGRRGIVPDVPGSWLEPFWNRLPCDLAPGEDTLLLRLAPNRFGPSSRSSRRAAGGKSDC